MHGPISWTRILPFTPHFKRSSHRPTLGLMTEPTRPGELTVLGASVQHPIAYVECFPAPKGCTRVRLQSEEVASICPVTNQPDLSRVSIDYVPAEFCVESKSLKLYLWSFRDRAIFAEALSAEIATEIMRAASPQRVTVTVTQGVRGGIVVETESTLGASG